MGSENLNLGDIYCIPLDGGEPIKFEGIQNIEFKILDTNEYEAEPNFLFNSPNDINLILEITHYSKILNRFARKTRRYMRRKDQQKKRKIKNKLRDK
jgi:predicted nucleotide-binding protein (sugar kinase/HSP70/actin superfamily)